MNDFFSFDFHISNIALCMYIPSGFGQPIHKDRANHGLVLQLTGQRQYCFEDGYAMTVRQGDVFYLPKFSSYRVSTMTGGDCIAINFDLLQPNVTFAPFCRTVPQFGQYKQYFQKALQAWDMPNIGAKNICFASLYDILCDLQADAVRSYLPPKAKQLVYDSADYLQHHIADCKLTVQKIADHFGISPEYYRKLFRQVFSLSPRRYLIDARMKKAKELLQSKEFSVSDIAKMCGYDSESYFSAEFKKHCGIAPSLFGGK